jgi:hypothetical protein
VSKWTLLNIPDPDADTGVTQIDEGGEGDGLSNQTEDTGD